MDLIIAIDGTRITTDLFEKDLNLYQYIPPHSAHPPGVLSGVIMGNTHRMYTLCSEPEDIKRHLREFFHRLITRGYKTHVIQPVFQRAAKAAATRRRSPVAIAPSRPSDTRQLMFFHIRYHPNDPPARLIQEQWRRCISEPPFERPLHLTPNNNQPRKKIGVKRMFVAYSCPHNLGILLSYRVLNERHGPPVSLYLTRNTGA